MENINDYEMNRRKAFKLKPSEKKNYFKFEDEND